MRTNRFLWPAIAVAIFLFSWDLFLWGISSPHYLYFDEIRYVYAAKELLRGGVNQNWSHPPLAKLLIGAGVALFGDEPLGWRFMSTVAGAIIVLNIYLWGLSMFRDWRDAGACAALALFNQVHFVQSRIATLDIFMMAFVMAGLSAFSAWWLMAVPRRGQTARWLGFSALCFALGIACKWVAVLPALMCLILFLVRRPRNYLLAAAAVLAVVMIYLSASAVLLRTSHPFYAPQLNGQTVGDSYTLRNLINVQFEMMKSQLNFKNPSHPYFSHWATWPLGIYPVWYDRAVMTINGQNEIAAIGYIGNPVIFWTGLLAVIACAYLSLRRRSRTAMIITLSYLSFWLPWAVLPRSTGFAYYYYPSAMFLSFAIVNAVRELKIRREFLALFLIISAGVFCFFYPVLTDNYLSEPAFHQRLWLPTWIK